METTKANGKGNSNEEYLIAQNRMVYLIQAITEHTAQAAKMRAELHDLYRQHESLQHIKVEGLLK